MLIIISRITTKKMHFFKSIQKKKVYRKRKKKKGWKWYTRKKSIKHKKEQEWKMWGTKRYDKCEIKQNGSSKCYCVRVLQKNRNNRNYIYKEIYKKLAHATLDLRSPKIYNQHKLETQEELGVYSGMKGSQITTQEEPVFQLESEGRKRPIYARIILQNLLFLSE